MYERIVTTKFRLNDSKNCMIITEKEVKIMLTLLLYNLKIYILILHFYLILNIFFLLFIFIKTIKC